MFRSACLRCSPTFWVVRVFDIRIVAHTSRANRAHRLAAWLHSHQSAERVSISIDDGTLGAFGNHRRSLLGAHEDAEYAPVGRTHALILEDDALPCIDLLDAASHAVAERPDHLLGLYVGRHKPTNLQAVIELAVSAADANGSDWLDVGGGTLWGVGYVMPISNIPAVVARADELDNVGMGADLRIGHWHAERNRLSFPWPSLVEHGDLPSLSGSFRPRGRVAWRTRPLAEW